MSGPIVDAHQHFFNVDRFTYPWMRGPAEALRRNFLPEDLKPLLSRLGIQRTVLVQAGAIEGDTSWFLELAQAHDFIAGVVGWVDLTDPQVGQTLDALQGHAKFKGVRHLVEDEPDDRWLVREDVLRGLEQLAQRDIPYDLVVHPRHLRCVSIVAERLPRLRMVVDHIAKPPIALGTRGRLGPGYGRHCGLPTGLLQALGDDYRGRPRFNPTRSRGRWSILDKNYQPEG